MVIILKKLIIFLAITLLIASGFYYIGTNYKDEIYMFYRENILKVKDDIKLTKNNYYKDKDYYYVQNTNDFVAKDKKHLLNIFYTVINSGMNKFTFYCDENYKDCTSDVVSITSNKEVLSDINNFVHPYNSFEVINASYDNYGQVDLDIKKVYSDEDIKVLNDKVGKVIKSKINKKMSDKKRIEVIHDYIINNGKYATDKMRKKNPDKSYNKANDILINHVGLCSAYADAMAIFLYEFGVDNYKIASTNHVWNLVKVNKKWLHLDLTWDDPITKTGVQKLEKIFLLIDNDELKELKVSQHKFNDNLYKEALN